MNPSRQPSWRISKQFRAYRQGPSFILIGNLQLEGQSPLAVCRCNMLGYHTQSKTPLIK